MKKSLFVIVASLVLTSCSIAFPELSTSSSRVSTSGKTTSTAYSVPSLPSLESVTPIDENVATPYTAELLELFEPKSRSTFTIKLTEEAASFLNAYQSDHDQNKYFDVVDDILKGAE